MTGDSTQERFDVCIVGSGFGGSMTALKLVRAGYRVLMIERGDWVKRGPHNWDADGTIDRTPFYNMDNPYRVVEGGNAPEMGVYSCVGGPSVFYGGVSLRFRENDFRPPESIVGDSGAKWPFEYSDLAQYYDAAEGILDVAGEAGDPTEPPRDVPYRQSPAELSKISQALSDAGQAIGLKPFKLPLAINYRAGERKCQTCPTCDTYACAVSAKNDLATTVLASLIKSGMVLKSGTAAVELIREGKRVDRVRCFDREKGDFVEYRAKWFISSAGALGTPYLLLASGLDQENPAGQYVGRHLMRHVNGIAFGLFPKPPGPVNTFHKQIGFHDFYFDHPAWKDRGGKVGAIQQLHSPPVGLVYDNMPWWLRPIKFLVKPLVRRMTGLLVMAEDQPQARNHVAVDRSKSAAWGMPQLVVSHQYSERDLAARAVLLKEAKKVLRKAGAWFFYTHQIATFSHACGTVRMGADADLNPIDEDCRFRGIENLSVVDGSVFPTAAAVNPSLTISANALRVGDRLVEAGLQD